MSDKPFILRSLCILDDPRVLQLPDRLWRVYLELYLHACRVECGIALPLLEYMAWRIGRYGGNLQVDLPGLEAAGLALQREPGHWFVRGCKAGDLEIWLEAFKDQRDNV
jgi:hypothetical protein